MHVKIISFTDRGFKLAEAISAAMPSHDTEIDTRGISPSAVCEGAFRDREALVFIGAMGIAVRSAAPYIKDKLTDPPLIVIDEAGRYVIPVLSGHLKNVTINHGTHLTIMNRVQNALRRAPLKGTCVHSKNASEEALAMLLLKSNIQFGRIYSDD